MSRSLTTAGVEVRSSSRTSTSTRNPRPTPGHPHSTRKSHYSELERVDVWNEKAIPYVTRTDLDNSVKSLVSSVGLSNIEAGNAIVVGDTTSTISYQCGPFVAGEHIIAARADWMNKYTGLFITCLLRQERYRYSYGRAYKLASIRNTEIRLPVKGDGTPDWQWMENYIRLLPYGDRLE